MGSAQSDAEAQVERERYLAKIEQEYPALQAERDRLAEENQRMQETLAWASQTFFEYAEIHRAKGTPEGEIKAKKNLEYADRCAQAYAAVEMQDCLWCAGKGSIGAGPKVYGWRICEHCQGRGKVPKSALVISSPKLPPMACHRCLQPVTEPAMSFTCSLCLTPPCTPASEALAPDLKTEQRRIMTLLEKYFNCEDVKEMPCTCTACTLREQIVGERDPLTMADSEWLRRLTNDRIWSQTGALNERQLTRLRAIAHRLEVGPEEPEMAANAGVPDGGMTAAESVPLKPGFNFTETGEVRPPHAGEWFRDLSGNAIQARFDFAVSPYPILRCVIVSDDGKVLAHE